MSDSSDFDLTTVTRAANARALDFGLLANFIHQVINPLSGTSGHIGNLIEGTIPEAKREQRMRAARAQLEHAISLMRNLAYFSQISQDPSNPNPGAVRKTCVIPQVIIEAMQFYQEMAAKKGISIEHLNRWDQFKVVGNPDLLRQVFMNLVDNAVKYAQSNSRVTFEVRCQKRSGNLLIDIKSKGTPIKPDEINKIFDLGFRGSAAIKSVASGTGLGLHICRTIIEGVHKGQITASSSREGITTFTIRFPSYTLDGAAASP